MMEARRRFVSICRRSHSYRWANYATRPQFIQSRLYSNDVAQPEREAMDVDVCIVGGGPAGLAAAIRLKQLAAAAGTADDFSVVLLEKAGELGDHILSGNVMEPVALNKLLPNWNDPNTTAPL